MINIINLKPYHIENILNKQQNTLENLSTRLQSVSIESVLQRGFAWVKNNQHQTIYTIKQAKQSSIINIQFVDGVLTTNLTGKKNEKNLQGDLFDML